MFMDGVLEKNYPLSLHWLYVPGLKALKKTKGKKKGGDRILGLKGWTSNSRFHSNTHSRTGRIQPV